MLKINKKVEYALIALKFMATRQKEDGEKLTSAREVCDQFQTPFDTTAKVMQKMNNHRILTSVKGIKGGYSLAKPLGEITYMELVDIIEGKRKEHFCQTTKGLCECFDHCNIKSPIENLNRKLDQFLTNLTLEELLFRAGPEKTINDIIDSNDSRSPSQSQEDCPGAEFQQLETLNQANEAGASRE